MLNAGRERMRPSPIGSAKGLWLRVWHGWLRFARVVGTVQMIVVLSLVYWTLAALIAIPFRLFVGSLARRRSHQSGWVRRHPVPDVLDAMKKQF